LGREPRRDEADSATAITFDWLILELLHGNYAREHEVTSVCRAVLSSESQRRRLPGDRMSLLDSTLSSGLLSLEFIDEERHIGGYIRQHIAELSDCALLIGGGRGVADIHDRFARRGVPVLPCDIEVGSSCNDGSGSLGLNRKAFTAPELFLPCNPQLLRDRLFSVSLASNSVDVDVISERVVSLYDAEFRCRAENAVAPSEVVSKELRVLFAAAAPIDQLQLELDHEGLGIVECLLNGVSADRIQVNVVRQTTPDSLRSMLAKYRPNVIHFSGHGYSDGIVLQDNTGHTYKVGKASLASLLGVFSKDIRIVILNSCSSGAVAEELVKNIDFAVGMKADVYDVTAIAFSEGFFDGFANGASVMEAFNLGLANCSLKRTPSPDLPTIYVHSGVDANKVTLLQRE